MAALVLFISTIDSPEPANTNNGLRGMWIAFLSAFPLINSSNLAL